LLAAFRLRGANGQAPGELAERYASGLVAGTGHGTAAWPPIYDLSQPMVEAASVAIGLFETRPWIWDHLSATEKARAVDWLGGVHGKQYWPNNWLLFQVIVNAFLKSVGAPFRQTEIDGNLDRIDSMYRRNGWYSDGPGHNYDHYIGWAMHLYTILWCRMDGDSSAADRAALYKERLKRFLEDYRHLFGGDGAPLYQGRSLIYRFAATTPLWAGALAEATPLPAGETRRLASGSLRYFLDNGCLRDGILSMGWKGEFLPMAQAYSGPASPYWASKAFLGLLLPPQHEVWSAQEEPMPVERSDFCRPMPEPGFVAHGTRADGIVRVTNHRSDHFPFPGVREDPHYGKLAYSTHTAPEIGDDGNALDIDSHVALLDPSGTVSRRRRFHTIAVADRFAASIYYPGETAVLGDQSFPLWLERIETASIVHHGAEIRVHHVTSPWPRAVREGGFTIAGAVPVNTRTGTGWSLAENADGLTSFVGALHGYKDAGVEERQNTNAFGRHSATPFLTAPPFSRSEAIFVSMVVLAGRPVDPVELLATIQRIEVEGRCVTIHGSDGESFFVQCVAPDTVDRPLGSARISGPVRFARVSPAGEVFTLTGV
jgi:hypothetical protein